MSEVLTIEPVEMDDAYSIDQENTDDLDSPQLNISGEATTYEEGEGQLKTLLGVEELQVVSAAVESEFYESADGKMYYKDDVGELQPFIDSTGEGFTVDALTIDTVGEEAGYIKIYLGSEYEGGFTVHRFSEQTYQITDRGREGEEDMDFLSEGGSLVEDTPSNKTGGGQETEALPFFSFDTGSVAQEIVTNAGTVPNPLQLPSLLETSNPSFVNNPTPFKNTDVHTFAPHTPTVEPPSSLVTVAIIEKPRETISSPVETMDESTLVSLPSTMISLPPIAAHPTEVYSLSSSTPVVEVPSSLESSTIIESSREPLLSPVEEMDEMVQISSPSTMTSLPPIAAHPTEVHPLTSPLTSTTATIIEKPVHEVPLSPLYEETVLRRTPDHMPEQNVLDTILESKVLPPPQKNKSSTATSPIETIHIAYESPPVETTSFSDRPLPETRPVTDVSNVAEHQLEQPITHHNPDSFIPHTPELSSPISEVTVPVDRPTVNESTVSVTSEASAAVVAPPVQTPLEIAATPIELSDTLLPPTDVQHDPTPSRPMVRQISAPIQSEKSANSPDRPVPQNNLVTEHHDQEAPSLLVPEKPRTEKDTDPSPQHETLPTDVSREVTREKPPHLEPQPAFSEEREGLPVPEHHDTVMEHVETLRNQEPVAYERYPLNRTDNKIRIAPFFPETVTLLTPTEAQPTPFQDIIDRLYASPPGTEVVLPGGHNHDGTPRDITVLTTLEHDAGTTQIAYAFYEQPLYEGTPVTEQIHRITPTRDQVVPLVEPLTITLSEEHTESPVAHEEPVERPPSEMRIAPRQNAHPEPLLHEPQLHSRPSLAPAEEELPTIRPTQPVTTYRSAA